MTRVEIIDKILEFTKQNGGHIGFKEVEIGYGKFHDVSIYSDGIMKFTTPSGIFHTSDVNMKNNYFIYNVLKLISENKFL